MASLCDCLSNFRGFMKLPEKWLLWGACFVVWLFMMAMIIHHVETSGAFSSPWFCGLVVGVVAGLGVSLVDSALSLIIRLWRGK